MVVVVAAVAVDVDVSVAANDSVGRLTPSCY